MHMADALLSPAVGGVMWATTGVVVASSARRVRDDLDESKIPLMGVAGAFVFAAQMVNFTIPATGSSGHLGGALMLAVLLGPEAAFLVIASVLAVQALFFADGGLLALGANIFNLGFFPAFVAYPLIYRRIVGDGPAFDRRRVIVGSLLAAIVGLQLGALAVVLETTASGITELPFSTFLWLMQPIHLAIGVVEGLVTAGVVLFVYRAQPELLARTAARKPLAGLRLRPVLIGLAVAALVVGGVLSWFASTHPDGLEWSIAKITGTEERLQGDSAAHEAAAKIQEKTAVLPGYGLNGVGAANGADEGASGGDSGGGTSLSGVAGALIVLAVAGALGFALRRRSATRAKARA
jgi:cobalt/nickel transport system permease protein